MNKLSSFINLLDNAFNRSPRNVPETSIDIFSKYPISFEYIDRDGIMIAGSMIIHLSKNIFGITNFAVHPDYQNKGWGSILLARIHSKHEGMFILKSRSSAEFYIKNGYIKVGDCYLHINKDFVDW